MIPQVANELVEKDPTSMIETIFKPPFKDKTWPSIAPSCSDAGCGYDTICTTSDFAGKEITSYR